MSELWKNKKDRAYAHQLLEKALPIEFNREKTRIIQTAAAMNNVGEIWDLAEEMREFCRFIERWYTNSFSNMDLKIMRLRRYDLITDDDLASFTDNTRERLLQKIRLSEEWQNDE